jgi:DNA primase
MARDDVDIDITDLLDWLGVKGIQRDGREVYFKCPFPGHRPGSSNTNASFRPSDKHPWWIGHCFVCGFSGTAIDFYQQHQGIKRPSQAKTALLERYGITTISTDRRLDQIRRVIAGRKKTATPANPPIDERHLKERHVIWKDAHAAWKAGTAIYPFDYFFDRGFDWRTLVEWEIGFDPISEMFSIPYRDAQHRLIGFKGRAWWPDAKPKYRALGNKEDRENRFEFDSFDTSKTLFGIWRAAKQPQGIVVEGELNTIAMSQHGYPNAVGLSGQFLTQKQAHMVQGIFGEVVLIFDEVDRAMQAAELIGYQHCKLVPVHERDPADAETEEVDAWMADLTPARLVTFL